MSVNSIADGSASFKPTTVAHAASVKQSVAYAATAVDSAKNQVPPLKVTDGKLLVPANGAVQKTARGMSHMVESYDSNGKVLTKYVDSSNNVIYQTPSEMVQKTQELMTKTEANAADVKG